MIDRTRFAELSEGIALAVPGRDWPAVLRFDLPRWEELRDAALAALSVFGFHGWSTAEGESLTYGGLSLVYNPSHQDDVPPNASTLGSARIPRREGFYGAVHTHDRVRDSYFDSYGFRRLSPAGEYGALGDFLMRSHRSVIRSRLAVIDGAAISAGHQPTSSWHRDEVVFECLRVNIPLVTDDSFAFELEGQEPIHMTPGRSYSWDTNKPHRAYQVGKSDLRRVHLVLGFAPWFDYDAVTDTWTANEYLGRVHPLDMLAQGLVHPDIRL